MHRENGTTKRDVLIRSSYLLFSFDRQRKYLKTVLQSPNVKLHLIYLLSISNPYRTLTACRDSVFKIENK